ncbi:MAG: hypothetical protein ABIB47_03335 [Candidatus Woesearchaeota archaeon]
MERGGMKLRFSGTKNNLIVYGLIFILVSFSFFILFVSAESGGVPFIKLANPFNNTIDLDGNITFSYNVTNSTYQVANCSLIFNGMVNQTDSNITESVNQYFYLNDLTNNDYNWSINCFHVGGNESNSETRDLEVFIDTTHPTVTLNSPAEYSTDTDGDVKFNYTVTDNGWVTKCSLYMNISGTWQINQTNIFVQKNVSLYFETNNIQDDTIFKWNVLCYDFALSPNSNWGDSNWTLTINNSAPTSSTIQDQNWQEDNYIILNLSDYFSDIDDDILNYSSTSPDNITISINNGTATLRSDTNWYGDRSIIFYAFDPIGENGSSNTINLIINEAGDTSPKYIDISPVDYFNDTDGFIDFNCSSTDDYGLSNISLYTNTTGIWHKNQTNGVGGTTNFTIFSLVNLTEGSYKWACKFYDNSTQSSWSENRTFNVDITVELDHDIGSFTINHIDHNRTIIASYSNYLNNSLFLSDLTIYLSNGSIYFTKNMSNSQKYELNSTDPPLNIYAEKIRIRYDDIFYGNFTIGNQEWLNITLEYYYKDNFYQTSTKHTIEVKQALPT